MKQTKRQILPSGLWVVATPIGNLQDITPRAIQALGEAQVLLCEDTRRTAHLLSAVGLTDYMPRLRRMDKHTRGPQMQAWVDQMQRGSTMALVSDAGTPGINDPGAELVRMCHLKSVKVTPIPGVSAVTALMSICGFDDPFFTFRGFFPRKKKEQEQEALAAFREGSPTTRIWFESPNRIVQTLEFLATRYPNAAWVVAKELTKQHEKIWSGTASVVLGEIRSEVEKEGKLGEWVFAQSLTAWFSQTTEKKSSLNPANNSKPLKSMEDEDSEDCLDSSELCESVGQEVNIREGKASSDFSVSSGQLGSTWLEEKSMTLVQEDSWIKALRCLSGAQVSLKEAVRLVSQEFGISRKSVYSAALKVFGKKSDQRG